MARRIEVDKIDLIVTDVLPFAHERASGFTIQWDSEDIGFGEYTIYRRADSEKWEAQSEHMDSNEDKAFIKELMKKFIDELDIVE